MITAISLMQLRESCQVETEGAGPWKQELCTVKLFLTDINTITSETSGENNAQWDLS